MLIDWWIQELLNDSALNLEIITLEGTMNTIDK